MTKFSVISSLTNSTFFSRAGLGWQLGTLLSHLLRGLRCRDLPVVGACRGRRKRSLLWRGGVGLDQAEVGTQSPSLASWGHVGTDFSPSLPTDCPKVWCSSLQLISSPFAFMVLYFPPPESCYILLVYYLFGKSLFMYSYKSP